MINTYFSPITSHVNVLVVCYAIFRETIAIPAREIYAFFNVVT